MRREVLRLAPIPQDGHPCRVQQFTIPEPSPRFYVSVDSKQPSFLVSPLDAPFARTRVSVASKQVALQDGANEVGFASVADRGLRPESPLPKSKNASKCAGGPKLKVHYYPGDTIRLVTLFVKGKSQRLGRAKRRRSRRVQEDYEPEAPRAAALKMANAAPWGSAMTEMRPTFSKSAGGI